jgi:ComF family protein
MDRWQEEKAQSCSLCGKVHTDCRCMPPNLKESGCDTLVHLTYYLSHHKTAAAALVLRCKDYNDREAFGFLAQELYDALQPTLQTMSDEDLCVTFVPRRRAAVQAKGHDHAKQIAAMLAREGQLPCAVLLRRKRNTQQQKELGAAEREKNAAKSFEIETDAAVADKTVILIDDICTTGSSLASCTSLLLAAGARRVVCAVVAKTERAQ